MEILSKVSINRKLNLVKFSDLVFILASLAWQDRNLSYLSKVPDGFGGCIIVVGLLIGLSKIPDGIGGRIIVVGLLIGGYILIPVGWGITFFKGCPIRPGVLF